MASTPPFPKREEKGSREESPEEDTPQPKVLSQSAAHIPSKLQYVALGAPGPSGIKQCFLTVKRARRVPTLPRKPEPTDEVKKPRRGSKRYACPTCEKRFTSPAKLSQHALLHTGELPFSCELCEKKFNSRFKLVRHRLIHSEAKAFACTDCGKTFNRKDHLTNHVRVHNPVKKMYKCERPDCRKSYTSHLSYRKHAALHSAEEGNLTCDICEETFNTQQEIIYHLKVHTGSRTVKNETDKKFNCSFCERKFFTAKDVRRHLVVHTGQRDFVCPYCPQKFGRKDHLVRHVKNAHPDKTWKSTPAGPSTLTEMKPEPLPVTFPLDANYQTWKSKPPDEPGTSKMGRMRVPSSDIIVEIPTDLDIKLEPSDIKTEQPTSPSYELLPDYMYIMPQDATLPFIAPLTEPIESLIDPSLTDPGEGPSGLQGPSVLPGPSGLSGHSGILAGLLEREEFPQEMNPPCRLPTFDQAFHSSKPPPPPPTSQ